MFDEFQRVLATINLDHISHNLDVISGEQSNSLKFYGVIKADGYGHGAVPVAKHLEPREDVIGFATATFEEAMELRNAGIKKDILVLGYTFPYAYEEMLQKHIIPTVFRKDQLDELNRIAEQHKKIFPVHVKIDSGMNRIGLYPNQDGIDFIQLLLSKEHLSLQGIFTHFPKADTLDKKETLEQFETFSRFIKKVEEDFSVNIPVVHVSNSAAAIQYQEFQLNVVRAGIAMYGLWPSEDMTKEIDLRPALSLASEIVYLKTISKNTQISYGGTFISNKEMKIATIPVGYGDGYPRSLSNKGYVLIRGEKAKIVGRICMDQFMVDVTEIPNVAIGDRVTLIGTDGNCSITMEELSDLSGRFNYEFACNLSKRIPRIYQLQDEVIKEGF